MVAVLVAAMQALAESPIKHVVVLMQENRAFNHFFGFYNSPNRSSKVNGLTGGEFNVVDTTDPNSKKVYVDKLAPYIAPCDPKHGFPITTNKIFGANATNHKRFENATMVGFVEGEHRDARTNYCGVMSMFTPERIPIITTLAEEFAICDRCFASLPGKQNILQSGSTCFRIIQLLLFRSYLAKSYVCSLCYHRWLRCHFFVVQK